MKTTIKEILSTRITHQEILTLNNGYCAIVGLQTNTGRESVVLKSYNMNHLCEFLIRVRAGKKIWKKILPNDVRLDFYKQLREQMGKLNFGCKF